MVGTQATREDTAVEGSPSGVVEGNPSVARVGRIVAEGSPWGVERSPSLASHTVVEGSPWGVERSPSVAGHSPFKVERKPYP